MKKMILLALALMMVLAPLAACEQRETERGDAPADLPETPIPVATLAGPTGMGLVQLFDSAAYDISVYSAPDQITPKIISGEIGVATIPSNVAAVLYNRMQGGVQVVAVNTMGVLYIVESGDTVTSIEDLAGKTLYVSGQGATPEYAIQKILAHNGVDDVTIEFVGTHADLANAVAAGDVTLAMLPEPFISTVLSKNAALTIKIDINEEWRKIFGEDAGMPMGVTIVTSDFAANRENMDRLIADYSASVDFVVTQTDSAASEIVTNGIVASEAIAKAAVPRSGISFITGAACKAILADYFEVMFASNPESLGGAIPDDDIYYMP